MSSSQIRPTYPLPSFEMRAGSIWSPNLDPCINQAPACITFCTSNAQMPALAATACAVWGRLPGASVGARRGDGRGHVAACGRLRWEMKESKPARGLPLAQLLGFQVLFCPSVSPRLLAPGRRPAALPAGRCPACAPQAVHHHRRHPR